MILGLFFGFMFGLLGLFWFFADFDEWIIVLLAIISFIISVSIGALIGKYEDKNYYLKYIESYKITKETIEKEIRNKTTEEIEKIGLFNEIISTNSELAKQKIEYKKWYYYYLDYSLIDNLKPIEIGDKNAK